MILAAGEGRRMRPLTLTCPKPLLEVNGKSLIVYHIERLKAAGIVDIVINIAYLGDVIQAALGDGQLLGVRIRYSHEPQPLETGGAIAHALSMLGREPFVLVNGDVWTDYCYSRLEEMSLEQQAHLVLVDNPEHNPSGDFCIESGRLRELKDEGSRGLTFSGVSLMSPSLIDQYPQKRERFPLVEVFRWAMEQSLITAEYYQGVWVDVGTPERLQGLQSS